MSESTASEDGWPVHFSPEDKVRVEKAMRHAGYRSPRSTIMTAIEHMIFLQAERADGREILTRRDGWVRDLSCSFEDRRN